MMINNEGLWSCLVERTRFALPAAAVSLSHRFIHKFFYSHSLIALTAEICMWSAVCLSVPPSLPPIYNSASFSPLYFSGIHLHKFHVTAGRFNVIFLPICIAKLTAVIMVAKGDHSSVETVIGWPLLRPSY